MVLVYKISTGKPLLNHPISLLLAGGIKHGDMFDYQEREGYYFVARGNSNADYYAFDFTVSRIYDNYNFKAIYGIPLRCVAR